MNQFNIQTSWTWELESSLQELKITPNKIFQTFLTFLLMQLSLQYDLYSFRARMWVWNLKYKIDLKASNPFFGYLYVYWTDAVICIGKGIFQTRRISKRQTSFPFNSFNLSTSITWVKLNQARNQALYSFYDPVKRLNTLMEKPS